MFKKIMLFLLFAIMIIGAASAANQTSFKTQPILRTLVTVFTYYMTLLRIQMKYYLL